MWPALSITNPEPSACCGPVEYGVPKTGSTSVPASVVEVVWTPPGGGARDAARAAEEGCGDEARAATESARALHATRYRSVPVRAGLGRVKPPLRLARARRSVGISEHPDPEERHQEPR